MDAGKGAPPARRKTAQKTLAPAAWTIAAFLAATTILSVGSIKGGTAEVVAEAATAVAAVVIVLCVPSLRALFGEMLFGWMRPRA
jgi:hypothetical protein